MSREEWLALAERAEKATGPDRILDGLIYMALQSNPPTYWEASASGLIWAWNSPPPHPAGTGSRWACPDEFTACLTAITALIERELLHRNLVVSAGPGQNVASISAPGVGGIGIGKTEALARCAAFCRAMSERAG